MNDVIRPDHFLAARERTKEKRDHRGTLLTPIFIFCAWSMIAGAYHIVIFITAHIMELIAP